MVIVRRRKENRSRGTVAVELALLLPVILMITFGALRYGWFFLKAQQVTNAARYGARVAIRAGVSTATVENTIHSLLVNAKISEAETYTGTWESDGYDLVITTGGVILEELPVGQPVKVTITVNKADVDMLPMGIFDFDTGGIIKASVTMPKEGF